MGYSTMPLRSCCCTICHSGVVQTTPFHQERHEASSPGCMPGASFYSSSCNQADLLLGKPVTHFELSLGVFSPWKTNYTLRTYQAAMACKTTAEIVPSCEK